MTLHLFEKKIYSESLKIQYKDHYNFQFFDIFTFYLIFFTFCFFLEIMKLQIMQNTQLFIAPKELKKLLRN